MNNLTLFLCEVASVAPLPAVFITLPVLGEGGGFHHHLSVFLMAQKEIKTTCSFFLIFNKIELGIFCQKIKVITLFWAFFTT